MLKIAVRNAFRQKRRTILTALTMVGGFVLAALSIGWSDGTYGRIIDMFTRNRIGHVQVHAQGYLNRPSLYKTVRDYEAVGRQIESVPGIEAWSPRVVAAGLGAVGEKTTGIRIVGIDPEREIATTRFDKKVVEGRMLSSTPERHALIGRGLARVLHAQVGDELVIVSQAADGSIANDLYRIVGIVESGETASDRMNVYLHIRDAQELLVLEEQAHEIVIISTALPRVNRLTRVLREQLEGQGLEVTPWQEVARDFYQAMQADREGMWIMLLVIMLIVAVGVLNTVLMSVLERTREYGVLRALGTRPGQIIRLVVYETLFIALLSVIVGAGLGAFLTYVLSIHGLRYPEPITYGGIEFQEMYAEVNARSLIIPGVTVLITAVVVSLLPALRAARIRPARAMRIH